MKLLFICGKNVHDTSGGGFHCTNRNYTTFCRLVGKDNVDVVNIGVELRGGGTDKFIKLINALSGFTEGVSKNLITRIIKASISYDYVFIDESQYGVIAYYLKRSGYQGKIITLFHNVEYNVVRQLLGSKPLNFTMGFFNAISFPQIFLIHYNERMACTYSDEMIALNARDSNEIQRLYGKRNIRIIPISCTDQAPPPTDCTTEVPAKLVFVGSFWYANTHGILWFIDHVLPHVNVKLQIAGSGMDVLKHRFTHPKVEYLGYVSDLSSVITNADYVISPIFKGGGMKVKICEALMYGKNIIGTPESFQGYEIDSNVGAICSNKKDFIEAIDSLCSTKRPKFNTYSRNRFLERYSFEATLKQFDLVLRSASISQQTVAITAS